MVILLPKQQSKKHLDFTESDTHTTRLSITRGGTRTIPVNWPTSAWSFWNEPCRKALPSSCFWIEESTCLVRHLKPFVAFANSTTDSTNPWAIPTASDVKQDPDLSELTECPDGIGKKTGSATRRDRDNAVISGRYLWEGARSVFIKHLIIWKRRKSGR